MFPVYTGINRYYKGIYWLLAGVPCIHRDKPERGVPNEVRQQVFPVYTGINRIIFYTFQHSFSVPCIHRDKPLINKIAFFIILCSLYTQG